MVLGNEMVKDTGVTRTYHWHHQVSPASDHSDTGLGRYGLVAACHSLASESELFTLKVDKKEGKMMTNFV